MKSYRGLLRGVYPEPEILRSFHSLRMTEKAQNLRGCHCEEQGDEAIWIANKKDE